MFTVAQDTWNEWRKTKGVAPMQRNLFIGIKRASFLSHVSNLYRVRKEGKWTKSSVLRGSFLTLEHLQGCHHHRSEGKRKGDEERMFVLVKLCVCPPDPYTREFSPKNHALRLTYRWFPQRVDLKGTQETKEKHDHGAITWHWGIGWQSYCISCCTVTCRIWHHRSIGSWRHRSFRQRSRGCRHPLHVSTPCCIIKYIVPMRHFDRKIPATGVDRYFKNRTTCVHSCLCCCCCC